MSGASYACKGKVLVLNRANSIASMTDSFIGETVPMLHFSVEAQ